MITLNKLPFEYGALSPYISEEAMRIHYSKHHQNYVDKINLLIKDTPFEKLKLEEIVMNSIPEEDDIDDEEFDYGMDIFNNAAQVWNHDFFWSSLTPNYKSISGDLLECVNKSFGDQEEFFSLFKMMAKDLFGSGWVWLTYAPDSKELDIIATSNAFTFNLLEDKSPILCCDVWEHAYYLDYQNRRVDFVDVFLNKLANWDFASRQMNLLAK